MKNNKERCREYYQENRERILAANKAYTEAHPEQAKKWWAAHAERTRVERETLKAQVFEKHGNKCARCGYNDTRALQIDHVAGNGWKDKGRMGKPAYLREVLVDETGKFQILCANCNLIKKVENKELPFSFTRNRRETVN